MPSPTLYFKFNVNLISLKFPRGVQNLPAKKTTIKLSESYFLFLWVWGGGGNKAAFLFIYINILLPAWQHDQLPRGACVFQELSKIAFVSNNFKLLKIPKRTLPSPQFHMHKQEISFSHKESMIGKEHTDILNMHFIAIFKNNKKQLRSTSVQLPNFEGLFYRNKYIAIQLFLLLFHKYK